MSGGAGAIMQLITSDGKQDQLLLGIEILLARLMSVNQQRKALGAQDVTPTIADIERTHLLFTNATFKPFVQTTSEYRKEKAPGQYTLGDEVRIEIKHFGDFFADMLLYCKFDATDLVSYDTTKSHTEDRPLLRWCNYPGERLLRETQFEVNGNIIDEYHPEDCVAYRNFNLPINKRDAYKRLMGQEVSEEGFLTRDHVCANADGSLDQRVKVNLCKGLQTPKHTYDKTVELWIPLKFWFNMSFKQSIPSVAMPSGNREIIFKLADVNQLVGLVTRNSNCVYDNKWAKDTDYSVYTGSSLSESYATIDSTKLIIKDLSLWVNHLFVHPEIHQIYLSRIGFSLVRVHKKQKKIVSEEEEEHKMNDLKWPIETLFIGIKPKSYDDSDATNRAHHLDKWDSYSLLEKKRHNIIEGLLKPKKYGGSFSFDWGSGAKDGSHLKSSTLTDVSNNIDISGDYIAVFPNSATGGQLSFNFKAYSVDTSGVFLKGRHPDYSDTSVYADYSANSGYIMNVLGTINDLSGSTTPFQNAPLQVENWERKDTIDTLKVTLHGVDLFETMKTKFLSTYIPYKYGDFNINPPEDIGLHMVNFSLHPGQYQPAGHINISRAREFYITYSSSVIGTEKPYDTTKNYTGELHVLTRAINFLLISDGTAILRYLT